ncbi:hypothetical protein BDL97_14G036900 [Sphagnum fallax]|nr:hypothetical protein BDL97_14G036900 [Sphagnum fallax]
MAKGAGAKQSTKGSSCGSGAASQGELQQQGPDDGGAAAGALLASETWTKRVCEAVVETRDEGLCLAGERSEIRRSSSSWGANLLHHHGAAGSIIHHSKSYKTLPTSNTWMAGVSEMHSGFQGLWTRNFQAWFTKKALVGDDDTIMFITHNMVQVLFKYNHTQPFYVGYAGYASKIHCQNIIFSYEMAFGGAGYAISHPFAKELAKIQDSCIQRYPHFFGGDDHIYACVAELGFPLQKNPVFIIAA